MSWYEVELLNLACELAAVAQHGGKDRFRAAIARLDRCNPEERAAVLRAAERLGIPEDAAETVFHRLLMDLGVSSPQIDDPQRGFSFRFDGPLDMRMSGEGPTAADVVNTWDHGPLAHILKQYGEERQSGRVATMFEMRCSPQAGSQRVFAISRMERPRRSS